MFPFIIQNTADDQPKNSKNSAHSVSETIPKNLNLYPQLVQVPEIPVAGMVAKLLRGSTINPPFQQRRDQDRKRLFADSNTSLFRYLLFFFAPSDPLPGPNGALSAGKCSPRLLFEAFFLASSFRLLSLSLFHSLEWMYLWQKMVQVPGYV